MISPEGQPRPGDRRFVFVDRVYKIAVVLCLVALAFYAAAATMP